VNASARRSNTTTRVLSALVLAPLAVGAAWFGGWPFALFWIVVGVAVLYEWTTIIWSAPELSAAERASWLLAGLIYSVLMAWPAILLRGDAQLGLLVIVFLFAVVWTTDILGYFGGRAFGGPKLAPSISPSKTWSGAFAGTVSAGLAGGLVAAWASGTKWPQLVAVGLVLSIVSQIGDLAESAFKRKFRVKDSSQLIPGHGGVMDRLDGFWAAALCAALIGIARGGFADSGRGLLVW
jgi:phosphatidate cytidylyltransferase